MQDRAIVIIGGTGGIGLSTAQAIVRHGGAVVAVGRNPEHVAEAQGLLPAEKAHVVAADATASDTADRAIAACVERFGRCDGLYHVAGGSGRRFGDGPLHELTDAGIEQTLQMNLVALTCSNRAAARFFLQAKRPGTVLNMTSVLGWSPSPHHFATHVYAAAKAAVVGLTRAAAAYYAPDNIRFNAIAPALTDTPMARRAADDQQIQHFIATKQPLDGGRMARPEDLDDAAIFFLSERSRFITGQVLAVDGGWSVSEGQHHR